MSELSSGSAAYICDGKWTARKFATPRLDVSLGLARWCCSRQIRVVRLMVRPGDPIRVAEETACKRAAVGRLVQLRGFGANQAASVVRRLGHTDVSRWVARQENNFELSRVATSIELELADGARFGWTVARLQELLPAALDRCDAFRSAVADALSRTPCSPDRPWNLVIYLDEVTPGNPLRPDNQRKIIAFYVGFLELGHLLRIEQFWLCVGVLRASIAKQVVGGVSAVVRALLRSLLLGPQSVAKVGIPACLSPGVCRIVWARVRRILADEAACKAVWCTKGASGIRPCCDCKNVVSDRSDLHKHDTQLVPLSCVEPSLFDPMPHDGLHRTHDMLAAMVVSGRSKVDINRAEQASGLVYNAHGVLADAELRAHVDLRANARDPMHVMFVGGVLNTEMWAVLNAWRRVRKGFSWKVLREWFAAAWRYPAARAKHMSLPKIFTDTREEASNAAQSMKLGASELMAVYSIIRHFVEVEVLPSGLIPLACASYLACCRAVDHYTAMKHSLTRGGRSMYADAVAEAGRCHVAAYGIELWRPKNHYWYHTGSQWEEDGLVLDCWVHERKHQAIKAAADHVHNTRAFESSVLSGVLNNTFAELRDVATDALEGPQSWCPQIAPNAMVAKQARARGIVISSGDLMHLGHMMVEVCLCVSMGDARRVVARPLALCERLTPHASRWSLGEALVLIDIVDGWAHAAAWFHTGEDIVVLRRAL